MTRGGSDDGADGGEQIGAPVGAEPTGDFAIGRGGAEFAFAAVVVGSQFGMIEKGEQVISHFGVSLSQSPGVVVGGRQRHDGVELVIETASVLAPRALGQIAVAAGEHHGAQQQRLHARREHRVTRVDGILTIAQLVRQAALPLLGMSLLRAVEIGDPQRRAMPAQHLGHHARAAAAADHVDHHVAVLEHPVPAAIAVDAHAGFVRIDHAGAPQPGENSGDIGIEAWLAASERGIQRAFAAGCKSIQRDRQAEQVEQQVSRL